MNKKMLLIILGKILFTGMLIGTFNLAVQGYCNFAEMLVIDLLALIVLFLLYLLLTVNEVIETCRGKLTGSRK